MFDRLVCMNGGNPREDLIDHKDPSLAIALEHSEQWKELSRNHLEGRTAGFFCYGDGGGDELDASGRPELLQHDDWFDPAAEPFEDMRDSYAPLVWQCRHSGIEVPDALWRHSEFGRRVPYSENQAEDMIEQPHVLGAFDAWTDEFRRHVNAKGKVPPGRYRAYGYKPPSHFFADLRTKWRGLRMALGRPIPGTSPAIQQQLDLNRDATIHYKRGESAKRRD